MSSGGSGGACERPVLASDENANMEAIVRVAAILAADDCALKTSCMKMKNAFSAMNRLQILVFC